METRDHKKTGRNRKALRVESKLYFMKHFLLILLSFVTSQIGFGQNTINGDSTQNGSFSIYNEKDFPVIIGQFKDGKRDGRWLMYWENGNLRNVINYNSGIINGFYSSFYESGIIESKGEYLNGKENGNWSYFHENGAPSQTCVMKSGKKNGEAKYFYNTGELETIINYSNGIENGIYVC